MVSPAQCQVCGGSRFEELYPVADTNQDVPGSWVIVACDRCGLGRLDPMPNADQVSTFYRDAFYADDGKRFRPWMERLRERLCAMRGSQLMQLLPNRGRLLDFGAGSGHFAAAMRVRGWDAAAVDPYSNAAGIQSGTRIDGSKISVDCPDGHYDAITLWYVIEHLVDPRGAIREFHRALRPGGVLVLAQQDFSSVQARIFNQRWLFLDPPRHLFQFSPGNLTQLAEQEGFRLKRVSFASIEMGPFTILQSLLNCIVGNQNYLFRFLKNRKLTERTAQIDAGKGGMSAPLIVSFALVPVLAPLALLLYFALLIFKSGDTFALYLERPSQ
jgi:SAM-dependent methyltransferase